MNLIVKNNAIGCIIILSTLIASGKYDKKALIPTLKTDYQKWEWSFDCQNILIVKIT